VLRHERLPSQSDAKLDRSGLEQEFPAGTAPWKIEHPTSHRNVSWNEAGATMHPEVFPKASRNSAAQVPSKLSEVTFRSGNTSRSLSRTLASQEVAPLVTDAQPHSWRRLQIAAVSSCRKSSSSTSGTGTDASSPEQEGATRQNGASKTAPKSRRQVLEKEAMERGA
jgi:hypothetical protein